MVTEWIVNLATSFVQWLASLFPAWDPPSQLTGMTTAVNSILGTLSGFGVWVDFTTLNSCVLAAVGVWAVVLAIKLIRAVIAHVPQFGGAGD